MICFFFYSGFFFSGKIRTEANQFNYHKELALSFLEGKLDIPCPAKSGCHDLALKDGKYYFYQPPVPSLVFIPAVLFWGRQTPDSLLIAILGAINVFIFISVFRKARSVWTAAVPQRESLRLRLRASAAREEWLYAILWGLGTVHFYISMQGDVWHISKIMAQTFLLLAIRLALSENAQKMLLSGLFFSLACSTRSDLMMAGFFFVAVIWLQGTTRQEIVSNVAVFFTPFIVISAANLYYNYVRFGEFFEPGFSYMKLEVESGLADRVQKFGRISVHHLIANFYQEILKPPEFTGAFPFIRGNPHGFGILWATPFFLLTLPVVGRLYMGYKREDHLQPQTIVCAACLLAAASIATVVFLIPGHGYMQFAARYTVDFQIFLILVLALHPGFFSRITLWSLAVLSLYMNLQGAVWFTEFFAKVAGVP